MEFATSDEFRAITKYFDAAKVQFHTFSLEEDKTLRVVLKPIPVGIDTNEVKEDLELQGFKPIKVSRMVRRDNKPLQNLLVDGIPDLPGAEN
ncbi:hypothetical protein BDFB_013225, partial [Asbolus verrucosus]